MRGGIQIPRRGASAAFWLAVCALSPNANATEDRDAQLLEARLCSVRGDLDRASSIYRRLLDALPTDDEARGGLARVTAWRGQWTEAETLYREVLSRHEADAETRAGLVDVLLWQERWSDAESTISNGLSMSRDNPELLERQARLAHYRGEVGVAYDSVTRAEEFDPSSASISELADGVFRGEALLTLSNDIYPDGADDLRRAELNFTQSVDRLRLGFRTEQSQRFASSSLGNGYNAIYAASASYPFAVGWRGTLELGVGAPSRTVPRWLLKAEGEAPLPGPFAFSMTYNLWSYSEGSTIHILDPAISYDATDALRFEARYWLALALFPDSVLADAPTSAVTHTLGLRGLYKVRSRLELALGYVWGQAIDRQPIAAQLIQLRSHIITAGVSWRIARSFGLVPTYRFEYRTSNTGSEQAIHGLELSLFTRW